MSIFKVNKDNLTAEEKEELRKNTNVIHSDDSSMVVETDKKVNENNDITEIHEMND